MDEAMKRGIDNTEQYPDPGRGFGWSVVCDTRHYTTRQRHKHRMMMRHDGQLRRLDTGQRDETRGQW